MSNLRYFFFLVFPLEKGEGKNEKEKIALVCDAACVAETHPVGAFLLARLY